MTRVDRLVGLAVLVCTFLFLWTIHSNRWVMCYDEGIYLDGAERILAGQAPYRDFFVLTGPGTFWLQALAFKLFGVTFRTGRLVVILDIALLAACTYWLIARLAPRALGLLTVLVFLVHIVVQYPMITTNHRWDSAALAMAALTIAASRTDRTWLLAVAGAAAAGAAWCTPTLGLAGIVLAAWMLWDRRPIAAYAAAFAATGLAGAAWLAAKGALWPMVHHLFWTSSNYGVANRFVYGGIIGGYANLFNDTHGFDLVVRGVIVAYLTLPATLPIFAVAGWALYLWRHPEVDAATRRFIVLLCAFAAVMVVTTWPRMDLQHLAYVMPAFCVPAAALMAHTRGRNLRVGLFGAFMLLTAIFGMFAAQSLGDTKTIATRRGPIQGLAQDVDLVAKVTAEVQPGENAFVFPYAPIFYFLTQAHNPTRYSFLQPGMMTEADELAALAELKAHPPSKVIYADISPTELLRVWPSSDPARLRMNHMEAYLRQHYRVRVPAVHPVLRFAVLEAAAQ